MHGTSKTKTPVREGGNSKDEEEYVMVPEAVPLTKKEASLRFAQATRQWARAKGSGDPAALREAATALTLARACLQRLDEEPGVGLH